MSGREYCRCRPNCNKLLRPRTIRAHKRIVRLQHFRQTITEQRILIQRQNEIIQNFQQDSNNPQVMDFTQELIADHTSTSVKREGEEDDEEDEDEDDFTDDEDDGTEYPSDFGNLSDSDDSSEEDEPQTEFQRPSFINTTSLTSPLWQHRDSTASPITLGAGIMGILDWATRHKITLEALEALLQLCGSILLPEPNGIPKTIHRLETMLGLDLTQFERHVCINDCHVFEFRSKSEKKEHLDEKCPKCNERRYTEKGQPRKKFYSIPLTWQIENLKRMPEFSSLVEEMWDQIQSENFGPTCSFWGGSVAETILLNINDLSEFQRILALSIGLDSVNCFVNSNYNVTIIGVKIWNMEGGKRTTVKFILIAAIIPGPYKPALYDPYVTPLLEEITNSQKGRGILIKKDNGTEHVKFFLATTEQDHVAMCDLHEQMGVATKINCPRCKNPGVPNPETNRGSYQTGYESGEIFEAERKTDQWVRDISQRVAQGELVASEYGIGPPSCISKMIKDFDTVKAVMIEFFHKLCLVTPSTFWKHHVFQSYKSGEARGVWVMTNSNRTDFSRRISSVTPTHDLGRKPKDPINKKMKAADWDIFVVTTSLLAEGLIDNDIFDIWLHYRKGYMIHVHQTQINPAKRVEAASAFKTFGTECEKKMPITMMTLTTHLISVEADLQIDATGPLGEAMSSWIERLCGIAVEDLRRRRITKSPEKTMTRSYLLRHFIVTHFDLIPKIEQSSSKSRKAPDKYDPETDQPRFLGCGKTLKLNAVEKMNLRKYFAEEGILQEIPTTVIEFRRVFWKTEIHSQRYGAVRTSDSTGVAVQYTDALYFANIVSFWKLEVGGKILRLCFLSVYEYLEPTRAGTQKINREKYYYDHRVIDVESIDRKVIFYGEKQDTWVLEVPSHLSHAKITK